MPLEGFGVFQIPDMAQCEEVVYNAIKVGYRLFDTAAAYFNEEAVGKAIARAIADGLTTREELFIVTKLWVQDSNYEAAKAAIQTSLQKLGLDYVDLYLFHQPMGDYFGAYRAMEEANKAGKLKAIGVANCYPAILANICETMEITPAVDQVELHPFFQQADALENMKNYGVQPMAWGPLAEGKHGIFTDPELTAIGEKYGKSAGSSCTIGSDRRAYRAAPLTPVDRNSAPSGRSWARDTRTRCQNGPSPAASPAAPGDRGSVSCRQRNGHSARRSRRAHRR